ncbi:integrase [Burkholderiaceae bacterium 26]|nr:integrase [Burkholderiaceae bacterium 26]
MEWLKGVTEGVGVRLQALVAFLERYLVQQGLPVDPAVFLSHSIVLPDFYRTACPDSAKGIEYNNYVHAFLHFVLLREFSVSADDGLPVVSPAYRNPVPRLSKAGIPARDDSVRVPLPYGYIDELRQILAAGSNFRNWHWAQNALGGQLDEGGRTGSDWFPVTEAQIDRNDPDCVWRERRIRGKRRLEMWSPVRWVALLAKLILPARTFQVRMLDSGEADTWRFEAGNWVLNTSRLAQGNERHQLQQGVFRRSSPLADGDLVSVVLYFNTNKTADVVQAGPEKGYVTPWVLGGPLHQDVFYWLEKLRNWQETYNPVQRRTAWTELDGRHIGAKSEVQLASYPDTCFLFRMPEATVVERHLPLRERLLDSSWFALLETLELRLANRGETYKNGAPVVFLPPVEKQNERQTTLFPLHCLRVSLVTALAHEGRVPFSILQKLVGHSRLLMTLYYTKPGATRIHDVLQGAAERLEETKEASIQNFLLDTEHDQLLRHAICNDVPSLAAAIPQHPAARNPAGWMPMHHGLCLVGGNTSEIEGNSRIGGCHNGGPNIGSEKNPKYAPVPGGSRNCVRCRWFVTKPHYLQALTAHFNTLAYHFDEARNTCIEKENALQELKKQKFEAEEAGQPFAKIDAYRQAERIWEGAMKRFSDLAEDVVACYRLIERCIDASHGDGTQLIATGTAVDVKLAFEETESELLQLAGVCENAEVYPDLQPGKAVFRRSQLLDAALYRDDMKPLFMTLSEQEQLRVGNAFMRSLAQRANPTNQALGQRQVVHLMDAGISLSQHFGVDLSTLLPATGLTRVTSVAHGILAGTET